MNKLNKTLVTRTIGTLVTISLVLGSVFLGQNERARRPTPTPPVVTTRTPKPTSSPTPTKTIVPSATATIGVTITSTPMDQHNTTVWHEASTKPGFEHHHGVNPNEYVTLFGEPLADYLEKYGEISYPWRTLDENSHFGYGHHHGYVWVYDKAEGGCELFNNGGKIPVDELNCITDVLMQIHSDGTQAHLRKRFHSHYVFMRVCDQETLSKCRVYGTGGTVDYGILETPYKEAWCPLPDDPVAYTQDNPPDLNQPPYRTSAIEVRGYPWWNDEAYLFLDQVNLEPISVPSQFWSGLRPNTIVANDYKLNDLPYPNNVPNASVGVAWASLDPWGIINPAACGSAELDEFIDETGNSGLNNTAFVVYTVYLYQHPPAPVSGFAIYWTNRWGHFVEGCLEASADCVPFYVTTGGVDGAALLNRQVNPDFAPVHEFEVPGGGVIQLPPLIP